VQAKTNLLNSAYMYIYLNCSASASEATAQGGAL